MATDFEQLQKFLATQVKARRRILGMSQEHLALTANIDRTYVSQLERAMINPSLKVLWRLALVLESDVASLLRSDKP